MFVHISAVERAGLQGLADGQRVSYDEERDPKKGKMSAGNLKALRWLQGLRLGAMRFEAQPR